MIALRPPTTRTLSRSAAFAIVGLTLLGCRFIAGIDHKYLVDAGGGGAGASGGGDGGVRCGAPDDARNCGTCGHDCEWGACLAGVCQPYELAFTPTGDRPNGLAVPGDGYVYFFDYDAMTLHRVHDGGEFQYAPDYELVSVPLAAAAPAGLVIDPQNVYFSTWDTTQPTRVYRTDKSGSAPVALGGGATWAQPVAMAADSTNLYVTTWDHGCCIERIPKDGGPSARILLIPGGSCGGIAAKDGSLYITDTNHGTVLGLSASAPPLDADGGTGNAHVLYDDPQSKPGVIFVDSSYAYWADWSALHRKALDGGAADTLTTFPGGGGLHHDTFPWSLSVEGGRVYYAIPGFDGTGLVASVPSTPPPQGMAATPVLLTTGARGATSVVATSTAVYWMVQFEYRILKMVR